jgi:hypothetical protein
MRVAQVNHPAEVQATQAAKPARAGASPQAAQNTRKTEPAATPPPSTVVHLSSAGQSAAAAAAGKHKQ